MAEPMTDRAAHSADLERARTDFHHLLGLVGGDEWRKPTSGTRWTNEQLLFHMVFGYMVVQRLLILVRLFGHLPDGFSRGFAGALNAVTPCSTGSTITEPTWPHWCTTVGAWPPSSTV